MTAPRLRNATKVSELYPMNKFPRAFIHKLAGALTAHRVVSGDTIEGALWEEMFAYCVGAYWKPSNVGLDDIVHMPSSTAWGAKTVKAKIAASGDKQKMKRRRTKKVVRLISGRNSLSYSFGTDIQIGVTQPEVIGQKVLAIWNQRVTKLRARYQTLRTVVLLKDLGNNRAAVFEHDTERYHYRDYTWEWNKKNNIVGKDLEGQIRFTWQPHGSQLTIHVDVPGDVLRLELDAPQRITRSMVLQQIQFSRKNYRILKGQD